MFDASKAGDRKTLQPGTLAHVRVKVEALSTSAAGNRYLSLTLTVEGGASNGHKIRDRIMLTKDGAASEQGMRAVRRILEASGLDAAENPAAFRFASEQEVARAIDGKLAAVKTKVSDRGWDEVDRWLSPNQASGTVNDWNALTGAPAPSAAAPTFAAGDDALPY